MYLQELLSVLPSTYGYMCRNIAYVKTFDELATIFLRWPGCIRTASLLKGLSRITGPLRAEITCHFLSHLNSTCHFGN